MAVEARNGVPDAVVRAVVVEVVRRGVVVRRPGVEAWLVGERRPGGDAAVLAHRLEVEERVTGIPRRCEVDVLLDGSRFTLALTGSVGELLGRVVSAAGARLSVDE